MAKSEDKYMEAKKLTIFVGTWNVNGKNPTNPLGEDWLSGDQVPPDLYAIGFQELDLSKEEEWIIASTRDLHPSASYTELKRIRFERTVAVVFVKTDLKQYVQNVAAETVGGPGFVGKAGGVAIRFDFDETSLCFVSCHLYPHVAEFERRNHDYNEICSRMIFQNFDPAKVIDDHDQIYWFGDMNYRIMDLNADEVKKLLDKKEFDKLLNIDQLKMQQRLKKAFLDYSEGPITFAPTYKYDPGTDLWDSSEKNRPPAWCDRILYKGGPTELLCYRSHPKLTVSDHKPVSALFKATVKAKHSNE